jgi:hydrogenase maturation protease
VLAAAELLGGVPDDLVVVGVEPEHTDGLGVGLSPSVAASIGTAVDEAVRVLGRWGIRPAA